MCARYAYTTKLFYQCYTPTRGGVISRTTSLQTPFAEVGEKIGVNGLNETGPVSVHEPQVPVTPFTLTESTGGPMNVDGESGLG